ncbi:MAG: DMT family transporter [Nocardioidaceae bacterium]
MLLVSLAGILWGTIGPGVVLIHDRSGLAPLTISAYRALFAVAALLLFALATKQLTRIWVAARAQWRRVAVVGVLTAVFQMLFFVAVVVTGVSVTTVVCLGFAPVLLLVLRSAQQRRLPSVGQSFPVIVAVVGLLLVSMTGSDVQGTSPAALGILAALGSGAAYALSAEVASPLTRRLSTLTVTTATMSVAAAVLVPSGLVLAVARGETLTSSSTSSWLLIAFLGVVTMALAYALLFTGLRSTASGSAVVATLLEPVTAVVIAVLFLGEILAATGLAGSILILAAIASLGRQSEEPPPQ